MTSPTAHPDTGPAAGPAASPAKSAASQAELLAAKQVVWANLPQLPGPAPLPAAGSVLADDVLWVASHPVNELHGPAAVEAHYLAPLRQALPDLERRPDLFFAGHWSGHLCGGEGVWVTCIGHFVGHFEQSLFGIPAHGRTVWLRYGEFFRVVGGRIAEARILLDLVDLARQAGCPVLPPAAGLEILTPGPHLHDGLLLGPSDPAASQACLDLVMQMIGGLTSYNQRDLASMGMARFWHPQKMMWYGPGGIGTTRAIAGFERDHQRPFLHALPDRKGGNHRARFGEGSYAASTGWPSIHATNRGNYLGVPASNQPVTMRVMDWWRAEGGLLVENWVLLDLPHFFLQVGVDILARARAVR